MPTAPRFRLLRRAALFALIGVAGLTCRDRDPLAPGLPGRGALDVAPLFQTSATGGPVIELAGVRAMLIRMTTDGADTAHADASFEGDSAVLRFEVTVAAPSQLFALEVEALDSTGLVMFRGDDTVRVAPGPNPARGAPELRYVAPDTALTSLLVTPEELVLEAGDTLRLAAGGLAADESPIAPVALGWTSRARDIATVSALGTVTAQQLDGQAWIVARTFTGVADSALVTVRGGIASVVITPDSAVTLVGSAVPVYAEALDAAGTSLQGRTITWTSLDPDIASVTALPGEITDPTGPTSPPPALALGVTAPGDTVGASFSAQTGAGAIVSASVAGLSPGVARIVAAAGAHADTIPVRVESTAGTISRTEVRPRTDTLESLGDSLQLLASSFGPDGTLEPGTYTWIVRDPQIASVSAMGTVVALSNGETWVVVSEGGGTSDSAQVVVRQRVASVAISPFSSRIRLGESLKYSAFPVDGRGSPVAFGGAVSWSTESQVYAQIDAEGVAVGTGIGEETILASIDGVVGRALLAIVSPVERVVIVPDTITLEALGTSATWSATAYDSAGAAIDALVLWESSNPAVLAEESQDGKTGTFVATANGTAMVRATVLGVSAAVPVRVAQRMASIDVSPAAVTISVGGATQLAPKALDANGRPLPAMPASAFVWSVETPTIARAAAGLVEGLAFGTTNVSASFDGITSAPVRVDVSDAAQPAITFGHGAVAVAAGDSLDVPILLNRPNTVDPVDLHVRASDPAVEVRPALVRIDPGVTRASVRVVGRSVGVATLQAVDSVGGYGTATAQVSVQPSVTLDPPTLQLNATDGAPMKVRLSQPAPAGGVEVTFGGNEEGIVDISPRPVVIPAGHLAAEVFVRGVRGGSVTLVPVAAGVKGVPATIVVADALLAFAQVQPDSACYQLQCETLTAQTDATATSGTGFVPELRLAESALPTDGAVIVGAGQYIEEGYRSDTYVAGLSLLAPLAMHQPLDVKVRATEPTVVQTDESVRIGSGRRNAPLLVAGLRIGEAELVASAPGWADATQRVVVSTPHLGICCDSERFVGAQDQLTVSVADSLGREHPRISSLVVRVSSSNADVVAVLDTAPVIAPDESSNWNVRVIAKAAGTAWIRAEAGGHVADSIAVRVIGGSFQLVVPPTIGRDQRSLNSAYIALPQPATSPRTFTLQSSDPAVLAVPATVTIAAGAYSAYFDVDGVGRGDAQVRAESPDLDARTADVRVTEPRLLVLAHDDTMPVNGVRDFTVYTADSAGVIHATRQRVVARVRARDEGIIGVDPDSVVVEAGQWSATGTMRALAIGETRLRAQASSHLDDSTGVLVVTGSALLVNDGASTRTIGAGQQRSGSVDFVTIPEPGGTDVDVRISGARNVQVPATVTIPAGATWAEIPVAGVTVGVDTLLIEASGYARDTLIYVVTAPRLADAQTLPATVAFGANPVDVYARPADADGGTHATTRDLTLRIRSTNPDVLSLDSAVLTIPAGAAISTPARVSFVGIGSAAIIFEDAEGIYAPDTSAMVSVTSPPLAFGSGVVTLGMRQRTDDWEQYVALPSAPAGDVTVWLTSSDARVASVPTSVVIPAGTTTASVPVTGGDATGTVQITALADGYFETHAVVEVGRPSFQVSAQTWSFLGDAPSPITVHAVDHTGRTRVVAEDVTVALASSNPSAAYPDAASVTIRAGTYDSGASGEQARLVIAGVGTTVISARDARAVAYAYRRADSDTVQVRRPAITFWYDSVALGIGQYVDADLWVDGTSDTARTVTLTRTAPQVADAPASITIAANDAYGPMRVTGAVPGVDTIIATMPGYIADTTIVRVDLGTVALLTSGGLRLESVKAGSAVAVRLHALGPSGEYAGPLAVATTWTVAAGQGITLSADAAGTIPLDAITVDANQQLSAYFYVHGTSAGTATISVSHPSYRTLDQAVRVDP